VRLDISLPKSCLGLTPNLFRFSMLLATRVRLPFLIPSIAHVALERNREIPVEYRDTTSPIHTSV
jgi:hypothetical protein